MTLLDQTVTLCTIDDDAELALAQRQRIKADRNARWFQTHAAEIYSRHRGKCVCIAGEQLFVADMPEEAVRLARVAHPEDDGWFVHFIPQEKVPRIYANLG